MSRAWIDNLKIIQEDKQNKIIKLLTEKWGVRYIQYKENWKNANNFKLKAEFPMHIDLDSTDACNLRCIFCWGENVNYKRTNEKMSNELINKIFEEVNAPKNKEKLCAVNIGNLGEPLIYPETVYYILSKAQEAKVMDKFVHTNGHFLTVDVFKKLVDLDLTYLLISLDAIHEDTYNKVRGGKFQEVIKNVLDVLEYKKKNNLFFPIVRVSFINNDLNKNEKDEFINFFKDKVDFIDIQPLVDYTKEPPKVDHIPFHCYMPFQRMTIGLEGQIALCCSGYAMLPNFYIAKFPEVSIYDVWHSDKAMRLRNALEKNELEEFPYCYRCLASRIQNKDREEE